MQLTLALQCLAIIAVSLVGGKLPDWVQLTHKRVQLGISFVGGLMLGIALLHLLPDAAHHLGSIEEACLAAVAGLLLMFLLLRMFHFHEHEPLAAGHVGGAGAGGAHDHADGAHAAHRHAHRDVKGLQWGAVAFGLSLHTLIDGMALAAAVEASTLRGEGAWRAGLGVFLAILLHKPLDAVSITTLMTAGGWSSRARLAVNAAFAAMCPVGAVLFLLGAERFAGVEGMVVGSALGLSAGVFLCISMSDLLPEIEFHSHDRLWLTLCLIAGVLVAVVV